MHFGLTDEQQMIVDTVRSFVENEIYPHEDLVERTGEVPEEIAQDIKQKTIDLGFYACNFPESVGCAGLSHLEFALVERELGRGSMALNHFFGRPQNILMACEGEQVDRYLMPCRARGTYGCAGHDGTGGRIGCAGHEMFCASGWW